MKPHLVASYTAKIDPLRLGRVLYERHRGWERRIKTRDLAPLFFGPQPVTGGNRDPRDVAIREVLRSLRLYGMPIGTEDGPEGGVWWCASEAERKHVVRDLDDRLKSIQRMRDALARAPLEWVPPAEVQPMLPTTCASDDAHSR